MSQKFQASVASRELWEYRQLHFCQNLGNGKSKLGVCMLTCWLISLTAHYTLPTIYNGPSIKNRTENNRTTMKYCPGVIVVIT